MNSQEYSSKFERPLEPKLRVVRGSSSLGAPVRY